MASLTLEQKLLFGMLRLRTLEETIAERYTEFKMRCPVHLCTGQEAVSIASGIALRVTDYAVSTHRAHGHYIGKGGDMRRMLAEIYGKSTGCARGKGGSMHLIDESVGFMGSTAIVGNTIPVGVGLGLSAQLRKSGQVSVVFLGDGAVEEGAFWEAANFAVLRKLPVVFICENNLYSVYSPLRVRQPEGRRIYELARALGFHSRHEDGNDSVAAYRVLSSAVEAARLGEGPQFIEFPTYRWREHCGPNFDNDLGYRTEEEYLEWKKKDPIERLRRELLEKGTLMQSDMSRWMSEINQEVRAAFDFADSSPFPEANDAYRDLYASH